MQARHIRKFCSVDAKGQQLLEMVTDRFGFSARTYTRILKVAHTIADPAGAFGRGNSVPIAGPAGAVASGRNIHISPNVMATAMASRRLTTRSSQSMMTGDA